MSKITVDEFKERLEALCYRQNNPGLPRKKRDQHILLKSITLTLDPDQTYSENELNQGLEMWLADVGQTIETDYVTLRRHLVDEGYLTRDPAGRAYRVSAGSQDLFETAINLVDPGAVIELAQQRAEERKRQYLAGKNG